MIRPATLELRQHLRGGQVGWVHRVEGDVVTIGRENNDINFPDDPFISGPARRTANHRAACYQ